MTAAGPMDDVTGVLLVGGHGRRMGRDKVLIPFQGRPLVAHIHRTLADLFPSVLLVGHSRPEFLELGLESHEDLIPRGGVLAGITTGLTLSETPFIFAVACDMPHLDPHLIRRVASHRLEADAVVPRGPRGTEPLFAVYSRACLDPFRDSLSRGRLRVMEALSGLTVASPVIASPEGSADPLFNLNRPEDLDLLKG